MPIDPEALIAASRAAPKLSPTMLYGAAAASPDDPVTSAQAAYAYGDISKRVETMKGQDASVQRSIWASLDPEQQRQFSSAGYGGPPKPKRSLFSGVASGLGHALGAVTEVPLHAAGEALHAAGSPLRQLQHAFRAGARLNEAEALGGAAVGAGVGGFVGSIVPVFGTAIGAGIGAFVGGSALPALFHPGDWADSWAKTEHGEQTFMPDVERKVRKNYGEDTFNLAAQLAGGKTQEEILAALPEDQRQALAERIRDDKDLAAARTDLEDGKISIGRLITSDLGLHPSEGIGKVISGTTDGVADWFGDPLMAVAKGAKASKLIRYGARTGEDVERLYQSRPAVQAAFEDVAGYLGRHATQVEEAGGHSALAEKVASGEAGTSALGELVARHPRLAPVVQQLVGEKIATAEELKDWMKGQKGFEQLLRGQVTGAAKQALYKGEPRILLPTLTAGGERALAAKAGTKKAIDFLAESDSRFPRAFGRFGRMATTLTPRGHEFDINGDDAVTTVQRVAAYILPDARVKDYVGAWAASDTAGKRTLFKGLLGEVFDHAGVNDTEEGRQWAQHFLETTERDAAHRAYASGGADIVNLPSGPSATGFLEGHLQETWSLPSYKALWAQGKRVGAGKVLEGTFNRDMLDHFMQNTWKPLSLLRIGFPLRSGGEELAAAIMREGPVGIGRGAAARSALKRELPGAQAGTHFVPRIWSRLTSEMTAEEIEAIKTPGDFVGRVFGNRASRGMAKVEGALAGDEYMNAARELYERGTLGGPFAREISAIHGRGVGYHWDTDSMDKINREGGRVRGMVIRATGEFKDYAPTEQHFEQIWRRNLEELGDSDLGKIALRNIDDREAAVEALVEHLESPTFAKMRTKATRDRFLRDGRSVEAGEATTREASIDWANTVFDHAEATVRAGGGVPGAVPEAATAVRAATEPPAPELFEELSRGRGKGEPGIANEPLTVAGDPELEEIFGRSEYKGRAFVHRDANGDVKGVLSVGADAAGNPVTLHVAVAPDAQRQGIATKLYAEAKKAGFDVESVSGAGGYTEQGAALARARRAKAAGPVGAGGHIVIDGKNLAQRALEGDLPTGRQLGDLGLEVRPAGLKGPVIVAEHQSAVGAIVDKGFSNVVGPMMDWMVREPLFIHNYATSKKEVEGLRTMLEAGPSEGMVRLWRGESKPGAGKGLPPWMETHEEVGTIKAAQGRWFTPDRELADFYATEAGQHGRLTYVDVPKAEARQYLAKDHPEARQFIASASKETELEYFLPTEIAQAKKDATGLTTQVEQHLHDVAVERAMNKTIPYIHDPRMRSQMHVVGRNMMPFQFAQEQFFKRWVNIFKHSPEAFREAQLTMNGIRNMGMVHTDENGNDYFMYPAVAPLQNVLVKGFKLLTGHDASIPLPLGFSGQVRFATPGLERLGLPSFGPLVSLPVTALTNRFPELAPTAEGVLGERGTGRPLWEQLVPTTLSRAVHAISDTADNPGQMHSATMQAMAYLEANGHGVPDDASPAEKEAWMDRVKNWARVVMVTRTLYGYAAPAAPEAVFDPSNLHEEFQELLSSMPIDQAVGTFLKAHPDATPYTIFQTKSASGAPLPATEHALRYMEDNREFLEAYPQAGGWFLPQKDEGGKFSMPAYREQMGMEMRKSKTLDEFYRNIKFAEAADTYFDTRDHKDALLKRAQGPQAAKLRQQWATWKDGYLTSHPIFAEELLSADGQIRRGQTLDQLRLAVNDERMPKTPQTEAMATLVRGWDSFQAHTGALTGRRDQAATYARKNLTAAFTNWVEGYVKEHPDVQSLYQRTIRVELES